jgi:hypothetical protein
MPANIFFQEARLDRINYLLLNASTRTWGFSSEAVDNLMEIKS